MADCSQPCSCGQNPIGYSGSQGAIWHYDYDCIGVQAFVTCIFRPGWIPGISSGLAREVIRLILSIYPLALMHFEQTHGI